MMGSGLTSFTLCWLVKPLVLVVSSWRRCSSLCLRLAAILSSFAFCSSVTPFSSQLTTQLPGDIEHLSDPAHLLHVHREHGEGVEAGAGQGGAELLDGGLLARVDQQQGEAAPGGPGRPPAPVDVGLRGAGDLVVDHVLDVGDVQAPGRHIRGHQELVLAGGEPVQVLEKLLLMELGVKGKGVDTKKGEGVSEPPDTLTQLLLQKRTVLPGLLLTK